MGRAWPAPTSAGHLLEVGGAPGTLHPPLLGTCWGDRQARGLALEGLMPCSLWVTISHTHFLRVKLQGGHWTGPLPICSAPSALLPQQWRQGKLQSFLVPSRSFWYLLHHPAIDSPSQPLSPAWFYLLIPNTPSQCPWHLPLPTSGQPTGSGTGLTGGCFWKNVRIWVQMPSS